MSQELQRIQALAEELGHTGPRYPGRHIAWEPLPRDAYRAGGCYILLSREEGMLAILGDGTWAEAQLRGATPRQILDPRHGARRI